MKIQEKKKVVYSEDELAHRRKHIAKVRSIAPRVKTNQGRTAYQCKGCGLLFTPEEGREGRFSKLNKVCARCESVERMEGLGIPFPGCFGVSYDAGNALCVKDCKLRYACLIQLSEDAYQERPYVERIGKRQTYRSHIIRILRAVGRPVHAKDLAPVLERETKGRFKIDHAGCWIEAMKRVCASAPEVFALGDQFYVWEGCWDIRDGGIPGCSNNRIRHNSADYLSVKDIFDRIDAEF